MKKQTKIIILAVLLAIGLGVLLYLLFNSLIHSQVVQDNNKVEAPLSQYEQHRRSGMGAEQSGKTADALAEYKKALTLCDDDNCKLDMKIKIDMMEDFLKQEKDPKSPLYRGKKSAEE